jgi:hypothetical protein
MTRQKTKTELTMDILREHGRITEAMGHAVFGRFHVGGAIFRLRNQDRDLVPAGKKIISIMRQDVQGNNFAEWRLVDADPANPVPNAETPTSGLVRHLTPELA